MKFLIVFFWCSRIHAAGYLTARDIHQIKKFWPDYTYAAEKTGVPVFLLPAIHYRESDLNTGWYSQKRKCAIQNVGGPFMLDCGGASADGKQFIRNIRKHETEVFRLYGGIGWDVPRVSDNFRFACLVAAQELKTKNRGKGWSRKYLAQTAMDYNGRKKDISKDPYLWSDPKHGKFFKTTHKNCHGETVTEIDKRPGVMALYNEITGAEK